MNKREKVEDIIDRGRKFKNCMNMTILIAAHIDRCPEYKSKYNEIRKHIGFDSID